MAEVLFIDSPLTVFLPRVETQRQRKQYNGPVVLLLDGHAVHVTPRVIASAGSEKITIIQLVAHSSHMTPLDMCLRNLQDILKKEDEVKGLKGETLKMYRAITALYKSTIVQMVRWSFIRAGFLLKAQNLFGQVTVHPEGLLDRISVSEITLEEYVTPETLRPSLSTDQAACRRYQVPVPREFAVNLQTEVKQVGGVCPLYGHTEEEDSSDEEEIGTD
jgi:hypothetical protein